MRTSCSRTEIISRISTYTRECTYLLAYYILYKHRCIESHRLNTPLEIRVIFVRNHFAELLRTSIDFDGKLDNSSAGRFQLYHTKQNVHRPRSLYLNGTNCPVRSASLFVNIAPSDYPTLDRRFTCGSVRTIKKKKSYRSET